MTNPVQIETFNNAFQVTPTITTDAYTAGDCIGGKLTLSTSANPVAGAAYVEAFTIADKGAADTQIDIVIFKEDPTNTTFTDNTALDIDDADLDKIVGTFTMNPSDYIDFADNSVGFVRNLSIPVILSATVTTLFAALIERGTPTRAVGDLIVTGNVVWVGK